MKNKNNNPLKGLDLFSLICKFLMDPPTGCGPQKESVIADTLMQPRADVQLAMIKLAMANLVRRADESKTDPLWALTLAGKQGQEQPKLEMKPIEKMPEVVEMENEQLIAVEMKNIPSSKAMQEHAAFLAQMAVAKTTFKDKLDARRAASKETPKEAPAERRSSTRSDKPYQAKNAPPKSGKM